MAVSAVATLLFLLVASPVAFAANHVVGGSGGWSQTAGDYSTWAAGETFNVGDTLEFNYGASHSVDVISKDDYDNCNTGNALESYSDGKTTIKLSKAGPMYFTCSAFGHCQSGMKLAVDVKDSSSTPSTPSTTPSTPSTTPSTPSDSPTTPTPEVGNTPSKSTPVTPNGAAGVMGKTMVGFSVVLGAVFAFIC
ncbi:mavicyanin [Nicotiana tabacum]|uniref:Mavicyanin n=2 Tax=Nicotiana TaxID=4085 RepID=A0A1S4C1G9_TOBAC|nr:PREDICTED: uclacyanin-3-like [Nicotiana sylvestris]XP_016495006.1 PREDICTED: uclacyanin-3-like [Nicotiana tabacum]